MHANVFLEKLHFCRDGYIVNIPTQWHNYFYYFQFIFLYFYFAGMYCLQSSDLRLSSTRIRVSNDSCLAIPCSTLTKVTKTQNHTVALVMSQTPSRIMSFHVMLQYKFPSRSADKSLLAGQIVWALISFSWRLLSWWRYIFSLRKRWK